MGKKNKIYDNCDRCKEDVPVDKETAYIVEFTRCFGNFVMNTCVNCGQETRLFVDGETQKVFERKGIPVAQTDQIPDPDFIGRYLEINNIPLPESHDLTEQEQETVDKFAGYLGAITVDARDFER